jgi:histidine triad (HIT) family protein
MASIFTKIINGEISCYKVAEDSNYFAFLDIRPMALGHTLVIPKKEVDYLFDLDEDTYIGLQLFAKKIANALKKAVPCKRIGTIVYGLEVPHAHIHLIPINTPSDMNISTTINVSSEEMKELAARISIYVEK